MADEKIRVDIESSYDDGAAKDALTDAEKIDKADPTLEVGADTSDADAKLTAVGDEAERLTSRDWIAKILAETAGAKSDLQSLEAELDQTKQHAEDANRELDRATGGGGGPSLRGNAIADLTGPLGEASGAASDFAGVFDGLGDAAEAAAGKLGLSEDIAGKLSSAIGGLGVAVAAGAAIWSIWTAKQEAAKKATEEHNKALEDLGEAITNADRKAAVANFHKLYDEAIAGAVKLGLAQDDVTAFITGQNDAIPGLTEKYHALKDAIPANDLRGTKGVAEELVTQFENQTASLEKLRGEYLNAAPAAKEKADADDHLADVLVGAKDKQKDMTKAVHDSVDTLSDAEQKTKDLEAGYGALQDRLDNTRAIEDFQQAMIDAQTAIHDKSEDTKVDIRGVEDAIVRAGQTAQLTPIEVQTAIDKVEQGDIDGAYLFMQQKIDEKGPLEVQVALHATIPKLKIAGRGGTQIVVEVDSTSSSSAMGAGVVNVNLPRGYRGDVVSQVTGAQRRNGRRYGARGVNRFARR